MNGADFPILLNKISLLLCGAVFLVGISTILLRRLGAWILLGQALALKAVAASAFLLSRLDVKGSGDLAVTSLVAMGLVPLLAAVGALVLHRCGRFGGTLDVDEETRLRH